jgi:hypothetical protein
VKNTVRIAANTYTTDDIFMAERSMLDKLKFNLGWCGPLSFLHCLHRKHMFPRLRTAIEDVDRQTTLIRLYEVLRNLINLS